MTDLGTMVSTVFRLYSEVKNEFSSEAYKEFESNIQTEFSSEANIKTEIETEININTEIGSKKNINTELESEINFKSEMELKTNNTNNKTICFNYSYNCPDNYSYLNTETEEWEEIVSYLNMTKD